MRHDEREAMDDIDRLFVGLATIDTPRDFLSRIAAQTYRYDAPLTASLPQRWLTWFALDLVALAFFAFLSVSLGIELSESGTFDLLTLAFDAPAIGGQFTLVGEAILQTLPLPQIVLIVINLVAIVFLSRRALPVSPNGSSDLAVVQ